ncbi:MAG: hypothetical protein ABW164_05320 [Sphingobium sp.]
MAMLGWIIGFLSLLGGLAMRQDMPIGGSGALSTMLFLLAVLACPMIWRQNPLGISRGQRITAALILFCCLPSLLLSAA